MRWREVSVQVSLATYHLSYMVISALAAFYHLRRLHHASRGGTPRFCPGCAVRGRDVV